MIPRTLVPVNVRPVSKDEAGKRPSRVSTYMDDRTVVPSELSDAPPLNGNTTIPAHLPLGVLVDRTLVPRGMPAKAMERFERFGENVSIAVLDSRVVVPAYVEPLTQEELAAPEHAPEMTAELREIIQPDIFTTGDANLLIEPEEKTSAKSDLVRVVGSVAFHAALILFLIFAPKLIPAPTQDEIARNNLPTTWMYSPPSAPEPIKPVPKVNVNRETLNKVAPPEIRPPAPPVPEKPAPELPEAPQPRASLAPTPPQPQPSIPQPPAPSRLEPVLPAQPNNRLNLGLPHSTPGKLLDDQMNDAIKNRPSGTYYPPSGTGGAGSNQGLQAGMTILTPTEGVNFDSYMTRLKAIVERNWAPLMPESARMGEKGIVATRIRIYRDGSMSAPFPYLDRTSGREPLDNAAMGALRASNPFPPLPSEFKGPYIEIEGVFFYNIDPNSVK